MNTQTDTEAKHPAGYLVLDEICAYCQHYTFRAGNPEPGQAYCLYHEKWFPNQQDPNRDSPGKRCCDHWERKVRFNENG